MLSKTKAIVLHRIKYTDNSIIAYLFTEKFGRIGVIVQGGRGKKSKGKVHFFQPLYILSVELNYNHKRGLQRISEISSHEPFLSIPYHETKRTIALFLAEILYKTLKEESENSELFNYLQNAVSYFDLMKEHLNNFHLIFLFHLSKYLGFYPENNYSVSSPVFDLTKGGYRPFPDHAHYINKDVNEAFMQLFETGFSDIAHLKITNTQRRILLSKLIDYYRLHFEGFGELKSLEVLTKVFLH